MADRAAVFDLDGTLVDNMRYHVEAWLRFCARRGIAADRSRFEREFAGRKNEEIVPALLGPGLSPEEIRAIAEEKESEYRRLYRPHLALVAGAGDLLSRLRRSGVALAIATAAPLENRRLVIDGLGLASRFDAIIGAEQAPRGKPSPDLFLAAARALGVPPSACVAFEDAPLGIQAAKAAGMFAVGITTLASAEELRAAGAGAAVRDFTALPSEVEARLFGPAAARP